MQIRKKRAIAHILSNATQNLYSVKSVGRDLEARVASIASASDCKEPGMVMPVIDPTRCEGKADCFRVCPYEVFEIRAPTAAEHKALSFTTRLKVWAHGGKQGFVVRAADCHLCGLCTTACPEKAIRLVRLARDAAAP